MKKIIIVVLMFWSAPLLAQGWVKPLPETSIEIGTALDYKINGKEYVCYEPASAQKLVESYIKLPPLELRISKLAELAHVRALEINELTRGNDNLLAQLGESKAENKRLMQEIDNQDAWYRSRYLWFTVGLVVGVSASVSIFYAAK